MKVVDSDSVPLPESPEKVSASKEHEKIRSFLETDVDEYSKSTTPANTRGLQSRRPVCRILSLPPRLPHSMRRPRRFLFSSTSEHADSSSLVDRNKSFVRDHSVESCRSSSSNSPSMHTPEEVIHPQKVKNNRNKASSVSPPSLIKRSNTNSSKLTQPSPYKQILICPHSSKRKTFHKHLEPSKSSLVSSATTKKQRRNINSENLHKSSSSESSKKTFNPLRPPRVKRSNKPGQMKSFVVVDDPEVEMCNLRCSMVMDVLASFVQQGRYLENDHLESDSPLEWDRVKRGDLQCPEVPSSTSLNEAEPSQEIEKTSDGVDNDVGMTILMTHILRKFKHFIPF